MRFNYINYVKSSSSNYGFNSCNSRRVTSPSFPPKKNATQTGNIFKKIKIKKQNLADAFTGIRPDGESQEEESQWDRKIMNRLSTAGAASAAAAGAAAKK
jgi:hypothetical protein